MTAWTERVRVGTSVLLLPLYHPVVLAKQLADLDSRSGGRLTVGVGVGGEFRAEFDAVGVPVAERGARTSESIEVLRKLWRGGPVSHDGAFYRFPEVELRPVSAGGVCDRAGRRSWSPGARNPAMRRAARLGDGWMPYLVSPRAYAHSVSVIGDCAREAGRDLAGFEWMLFLYCSVRRDGDQARGDVAQFLGAAYGGKPAGMLEKIAPAGTPDEVAAPAAALR